MLQVMMNWDCLKEVSMGSVRKWQKQVKQACRMMLLYDGDNNHEQTYSLSDRRGR
ncbi:MAG: hypothetical protein MR922_12550 [Lachnospiraceae bacterium]|nr:hypothetical protein [Lachnospiraceae bacterium]